MMKAVLLLQGAAILNAPALSIWIPAVSEPGGVNADDGPATFAKKSFLGSAEPPL
jgi:hypothetical protein